MSIVIADFEIALVLWVDGRDVLALCGCDLGRVAGSAASELVVILAVAMRRIRTRSGVVVVVLAVITNIAV